jgi:hypothetical protein
MAILSRTETRRADTLTMVNTAVALAIPALLVLFLSASTPLRELGKLWHWNRAKVGRRASVRQEGPTVSLRPAENHVEAGETFVVEVLVEGASDLGAFEFKLSFPPDIVHAQGVDVGEFLGSTGRPVTVLGPSLDNESGTVSLGTFTFGDAAGPTGVGTLATVTFQAVGQGSGSLDLRDVQLIDTAAHTLATSAVDGGITVGTGQPVQTPTPSPTVQLPESPEPTSPPTDRPIATAIPEQGTLTLKTPAGKAETGESPGLVILPSATPSPHATPSPTPEREGSRRPDPRLLWLVVLSTAIIGLTVMIVSYLLYRKR